MVAAFYRNSAIHYFIDRAIAELVLLSDPADAADAVRETFVIAAARLAGLREPERLRAWLYAVARSECLRIASSKKGTPALDEAPDVTDSADWPVKLDATAMSHPISVSASPGANRTGPSMSGLAAIRI